VYVTREKGSVVERIKIMCFRVNSIKILRNIFEEKNTFKKVVHRKYGNLLHMQEQFSMGWRSGVDVMVTVFGDCCQFLRKNGVFLKNQCYYANLAKISSILN
jgi:hypothetical protein